MCCSMMQCTERVCEIESTRKSVGTYPFVYCIVLQCVAVCCSMLQCTERTCDTESTKKSVGTYPFVCCSVLQCVAVCCSVLQCVAVCCSHVREMLHMCVTHGEVMI